MKPALDKNNLPFKDIVAVMEQRGHTKKAHNYCNCGNDYFRIGCADSPGVGSGHGLAVSNHCNSRICPTCAAIQGRRVQKRYSKSIAELARAKPRGHSLALLTLTQRLDMYVPLQGRVRKIKKDLKKFVRQAYPTSEGCHGIYTIEVGGNGMVHVHAVVFGPATSAYELKNRWHRVTGDSYIVDVRPVSTERKRVLDGAVAYILKYISKVPKFPTAEAYVDYLEALIGTRRLGTWGSLYGVKFCAQKEPCRCPKCGAALFFAGLLVEGDVCDAGVGPSEEFAARLRHALALLDPPEENLHGEGSCTA